MRHAASRKAPQGLLALSLMPIESAPASQAASAPTATVFFDRAELSQLLGLYGRMVSRGLWRDYAIDGARDSAVFSVYRRSSETPLYRIEKRPALARKQGAWSVLAPGGLILRRGHDLAQVLRVFDKGRLRLVE